MDAINVTSMRSDTIDYRYLYNNLVQYFLIWFIPVCLAIGLFGGAFCLIFFITSRLFQKSILIWLFSICVADMLTLLTDALRMEVKILFKYDFRDSNVLVCRLHNYLSNYFFYLSAYMQACMSLQRLYFILFPLRARVQLTFKRIFIVWLMTVILCSFPHLPYLLYWTINPKNGDCEPTDSRLYRITTICDMVIWGIIPLAAMTFCTILISYKVFQFSPGKKPKRSHHQNNGGGDSVDEETQLHETGTTHQAPVAPAPIRSKANVGQRHGGDNAAHVTRILVFSNLFYMFTTYPLIIYLMHLNFGLNNQVGVLIPQPVHKFIYYWLRSISYLNCSFNWFFYCAVGKVFRRRAARILKRFLCFCSFCPDRFMSYTEETTAGRQKSWASDTGHHVVETNLALKSHN